MGINDVPEISTFSSSVLPHDLIFLIVSIISIMVNIVIMKIAKKLMMHFKAYGPALISYSSSKIIN